MKRAVDELRTPINSKIPFHWTGTSVRNLIHPLLFANEGGTSNGSAMFQMMGVFAEFERAMIRERVKAGLDRARA